VPLDGLYRVTQHLRHIVGARPATQHIYREGVPEPMRVSSTAAEFLSALKAIDAIKVTRADLCSRATGILRKHVLHPQLTLAQIAEKYHAEFRYKACPSGRGKLIGTTLLVKGLEFDHAIVLDADSLSRKELYVAITRGANSLTIISSSAVLNPRE
jgi:hypothetical protein